MTTKKTETASVPKLLKITGDLHRIFRRGTDDVFEGRLLTLAKEEIGHGEFLPWLEKSFSLSERSAQRYMAAHEFMKKVVAPLFKSDSVSDLRLRPAAIYELVEMHSRGTVTQEDIEAVLKESTRTWMGGKLLKEVLKSRHPDDATAGATGDAPDAVGEPTTGEPIDMATFADADGEAGGGNGEQPTETPPDTAPKPKSAPSTKDRGNLTAFSTNILNLKRLATSSAQKYLATAVHPADLETVADFVRAVADLKKKQAAETSVSVEASAEARKAQYAQVEAA